MTVQAEIDGYIATQAPPKREELERLHHMVLAAAPGCELWFLDGRDASGKVVTNPNIGYGRQTQRYAGGETRDFYRVGLSANTGGVSLYVMGLADKTHLSRTYGPRLGKAKVTGYCIKFRSLSDVDPDVLSEIVTDAMALPMAEWAGA